jgi:hypothetical protein
MIGTGTVMSTVVGFDDFLIFIQVNLMKVSIFQLKKLICEGREQNCERNIQ